MSLGRKVAYNTAVQIIGRVVTLFIMLVTLNFIANHLIVGGSALVGYGQYTIVFAYSALIGAAADLGLFSLLVRDITRKSRAEVEEYVGSALGFRLLLMVITTLVAILIYPVLPYAPEVKLGIILGVFVAFSLLFSQTIAAVFQVHLKSERIVIAETVGRLVVMLLTIYVLTHGYGLLAVVISHLIGYTVSFIASYWLALPFARIPIRFNVALWRENLPQFASIALITLLSLTHSKIDSIMLSFFRDEAQVGLYGIAYKLFEIVVIIPSILASNLLPVITHYYLEGKQNEFTRILQRSSSVLTLIALYLILGVFILAPYLIIFISQIDFLPAAVALRILMLSIVFIFIASLLIQAVIAARQQTRLIWGYSLAVIANVTLNFFAIRYFSYLGAAATTVITEALLAFWIIGVAYRHLGFKIDWITFGRIIGATLATGLVAWFTSAYYMVSLGQFAAWSKLNQLSYLGLVAVPLALIYCASYWVLAGGSLTMIENRGDS